MRERFSNAMILPGAKSSSGTMWRTATTSLPMNIGRTWTLALTPNWQSSGSFWAGKPQIKAIWRPGSRAMNLRSPGKASGKTTGPPGPSTGRLEVPIVTSGKRGSWDTIWLPPLTSAEMSFSFLQRGSLPEYARQLVLTSDEPSLVLEGLVTGIDNLRHDVYLSPKFSEAARQQIFKLVAKHGNVEELVAEERKAGRVPAPPQRHPTRQSDTAEFKRLLTELHVVSLNRAKAESNVSL